jgi:hypothetical protein
MTLVPWNRKLEVRPARSQLGERLADRRPARVDGLYGFGCVVVLGEPGSGKTCVLTQVVKSNDGELVELRDFAAGNELFEGLPNVARVKSWMADDTATLLLGLDAYDEGLLEARTMAATLRRLLKVDALPFKRLRLWLTSRASVWAEDLEVRLAEVFGSERTVVATLEALDDEEITQAIDLRLGEEAPAFRKALLVADPDEALLRQPDTLIATIERWRRGEPGDREVLVRKTELYAFSAELRIQETNLGRRDARLFKFGLHRRLVLGKHLAAATLLANRAGISVGTRGEASGAWIDHEDLCRWPLVDSDPPSDVLVDEVLDSGLFRHDDQRARFVTPRIAEFLAASWLAELRLPVEVLVGTFLGHGDGRAGVLPQLAATAAWVADLDNRFELLRLDPPAALQQDLSAWTDDQRAGWIDALVLRLQQGTIELGPNFPWHKVSMLRHPQLGAQLGFHLENPDQAVLVQHLMLHIARQTDGGGIEALAWSWACDRDRLGATRVLALRAFLAGVEGPEPEGLAGLLADPTDTDDELRGTILQAWLRRGWRTVAQIVPHLTKPRHPIFFGAYRTFLLFDLPRERSEAEVVTLLSLLASAEGPLSWDQREFNSGAELALEVVKAAGTYLERDSVQDALVGVWRRAEYRHVLRGLEEALKSSPALALRLALKVLLAVGDPVHAYVTNMFADLHVNGLPLRDGIIAADHAELAEVAVRTTDLADPDQLAPLWAWPAGAAKLVELFPHWFQPETHVEAAAEAVRAARVAQEAQWAEERAAHQPPVVREPYGVRVQQCLSTVAKHPNHFYNVMIELWTPPEARDHHLRLSSAISASPGWTALDDDLRVQVVDAAEIFVARADTGPDDTWIDDVETGNGNGIALAGLCAVQLLLEQGREVPAASWRQLAVSIARYVEGVHDHQERTRLAQGVVRHAPDAIPDTVLRHLEARRRANRKATLDLSDAESLWVPALGERLLAWATAVGPGDPWWMPAIDLLLKQQVPGAVAPALACALNHGSVHAAGATASLLVWTPDARAELWSHLDGAEEAWRESVLSAVQERGGWFELPLRRHVTSGDLYKLLMLLGPSEPETLEPMRRRPTLLGASEQREMARREVLHALRDSGHIEALQVLKQLAQDHPDWPNLDYLLLEARRVHLRAAWQPGEPNEVLQALVDARGTHVFVCYVRDDATHAEPLWLSVLNGLREEGVLTFFRDDAVDGGADWRRAIDREIRRCSVVLAVVTATPLESRTECVRELQYATELGKKIVPVIVDPHGKVPAILRRDDGGVRPQWWSLADLGWTGIADKLRKPRAAGGA